MVRFRTFAALSLILVSIGGAQTAPVVDYDIVYVRAPRSGDNTNTKWPEVFDPIVMEPGADLMLLHPDGSEEVLFPGGNGAVVDPVVSLDGAWVLLSYFPDLRQSSLNYQRRYAPYQGADIYKVHLGTRQVVRLTNQEWTPPAGAANWSTNPLNAAPAGTYYLGYGIFNLGPCPLPGGKILFTSSRDGYIPNKSYTFPNLRLYVMDEDGRNVEKVGHINIGSALHPTVLTDGRVMFSSFEAQGLRDSRLWGLWAIWPDGRKWEPLFSAFTDAAAMHFQTQLSDGRIAVVEYYNLNNNGFGTLLAFPSVKNAGVPPFGSPSAGHSSNPAVRRGLWFFDPSHPSHLQPRYKQYPFSPPGLLALTGFTHGEDEASSRALDGSWAGKVTHPSGAPNNDVLMVYSPGPANDLDRPTSRPYYDGGIYVLRNGIAVNNHQLLVKIKNDPLYNEMQPRAVVPYSRIYGIPEPARIPWLPNDGSASHLLPAGTPFGIIGTSSFYKRNTSPGRGVARFGGLDPFNTSENGASTNWETQGADAGKYSNADVYAVRLVALEGVAHRSYGPASNQIGFQNHADVEKLRILGEIPLRKASGAIDPDGNPDTSFAARIPADTPFTFQTLDKDGLVLNMAQTWHMVRPGEVRTDCGGCHAHSQVGTNFVGTEAARTGGVMADLVNRVTLLTKDGSGNTVIREAGQRMLDVEYSRDIKPILQRSCVACHSKTGTAQAGLVLDDTALVNGWENTFNRLADDTNAQFGIKPVIGNGTWRQTNASRYVRRFQSRRSLLMWKIMGRRLDGWTNADHPTESTPGNRATLPQGANPNDADIDYTGTIMPPPGSGHAPLTDDEKMLFARWIDLGCPISAQSGELAKSNWFVDELKPTLTLSTPQAGQNGGPLQTVRIGAYDSYSGLDAGSLSVRANFVVNGQPAGSELGSLFAQTGDHIWTLTVNPPVASLSGGNLVVRVRDNQGNWSVVNRTFDVGVGGPAPPPPPPATTRVTIATNPPGLAVVVDGVTRTAPASFDWTPGGQHSLSVVSPTGGTNGTRYLFATWSQGGPVTQTITVPSTAVIYAASFQTQHLLTRAVTPNGGGTLAASPAAADGYYNAGASIQLTAAPASGYRFVRFSGAITGTANPQSIAMSTPRTVTAEFELVVVPPPPPAPSGGPRAAYGFESIIEGRTKDDSGNALSGMVSGAVLRPNGRFCSALSLDGVNDMVTVADSDLLDLTNGMTLMAWVRPVSLQGWTTIILKERPNGLAYALYGSDDTEKPPAGYVNLGSGDQKVTQNPALSLNQWTHLAVTFNGNRLLLFRNGAEVSSRVLSGNIVTSRRALRIGGNEIWGEYFKGLIDEVRVYGRALSQSEIEADLNRPSPNCTTGVDRTAPKIEVTAPRQEATVTGRINVTAAVSDDVAIREVRFYLDGREVLVDRTAPYSWNWNTAQATAGKHEVAAEAVDAAGNKLKAAVAAIVQR